MTRPPVVRTTVVRLLQLLALAFAFAAQSRAAFIETYSVSNFTVTNSNANGSAVTPDNGLTLILTGGNNGTGLPGNTDFTMLAPTSGFISFNYQYSSCDPTNLCDDPGMDASFYMLDANVTQIADTTGAFGFISFPVTSQQLFGFRVSTVDNTGEPGILTISNFNGPAGTAAVPEPSEGGVVAIILLFVAVLGYAASKCPVSRKKLG